MGFVDGYVKSPLAGIAPWVLLSIVSGPGRFEGRWVTPVPHDGGGFWTAWILPAWPTRCSPCSSPEDYTDYASAKIRSSGRELGDPTASLVGTVKTGSAGRTLFVAPGGCLSHSSSDCRYE
jgi:hypothetical protein